MVLPYVAGLSEKLNRVYKKHNITLCSKPGYTLRQALVAPKDPVEPPDKCGVVYSIECSNCPKTYIGETGRPLKTRLKEHQKSAKVGDLKSALSQHQLETGHRVNFEEVKVIQQVAFLKNRKVAEAIHIRTQKPALNRDQGYELPRIYDQILRGGARTDNQDLHACPQCHVMKISCHNS